MKTIADLQAIRDKMQAPLASRERIDYDNDIRIVVGMDSCGIEAGARGVMSTFVEEVYAKKMHSIKVTQTGCLGDCANEPMVEIYIPNQEKVTYAKVTPEIAKRIISEHIAQGKPVQGYIKNN